MEGLDKVASSKKAVRQMIFYYYQALVQAGCPDPCREIATEIPKMVALSEDQAVYIMQEIDRQKASELLENAKELLDGLNKNSNPQETIEFASRCIQAVMDFLEESKKA